MTPDPTTDRTGAAATPVQCQAPPAVIHRQQRIHAAQYRAENALDSVRGAAWDNGSRGVEGSEREARFASEVTSAVAALVQLALGVEDAS